MNERAIGNLLGRLVVILLATALTVSGVASIVSPASAEAIESTPLADREVLQGHVQADIPYVAPWSESQTQLMDIYSPSGTDKGSLTSGKKSTQRKPVIVYIHGGAWMNGDKSLTSQDDDKISWLNAMLRAGYVVVSINYRLTGESPWPAQINDCKSAIRFLRANANTYDIDPNRIAVFGESSGAHLAMMLGVTNDSRQFDNRQDGNGADTSSAVQAVVSAFGISDVDKWGELSGDNEQVATMAKDALFGIEEGKLYSSKLAMEASPINYASKNSAPMLLVHGVNDQMVSYQQTKMMERALSSVGNTDFSTWYPSNGPHASTAVFYANPIAQSRYLDFLSEALAGKSDQKKENTIPVYRFYNSQRKIHVFSVNDDEAVALSNDPQYQFEGIAFHALQDVNFSSDSLLSGSSSSNEVRVYRMYNSVIDDYVFTENPLEIQELRQKGWAIEDSFIALHNTGYPIHRLYNPADQRHTLVLEAQELSILTQKGWYDDGVIFYAL